MALITGGHLDVPIGDATGIGGRNQEFALLWAQALGSGLLCSKRVVVAAMDSDGTDGPGTQRRDAAGEGDGESFCMAGGMRRRLSDGRGRRPRASTSTPSSPTTTRASP